MSENKIATVNQSSPEEMALVANDLSKLNAQQRLSLINKVCESMGLNPLTQPFGFIEFRGGKLSLYAKKDCTDQLRKIHGVSITIASRDHIGDNFVVMAKAKDASGRQDEDMGAVTIKGLNGESLGNAMMKAITKAKRRVTLSICGMGMLDETEIETIKDAKKVDEAYLIEKEKNPTNESEQETGQKEKVNTKNVHNYAPNAPLNSAQQTEIFHHLRSGAPDQENQKEILKVLFKVDSYRLLVTEHYTQFKKTLDMGMTLFDEYINILESENALDSIEEKEDPNLYEQNSEL